MLTSITGINWGDEGKGRMVDLLSQDYDIVARYQGGDNAGHTVKTERGKFVLNLIPSGILRPDVVCVMGGGMVIDPEHLEKEIASLTEKGVEISPKNLKISDRATITMPFHEASRSPWAVKRTYSAPASIIRIAWQTAASVSIVETFAIDWMRIGLSPPNGVFPMLTIDDLRRR